ncbi:tail tape measure protein [Sphingomonas naphthae]|uniref:Tail tape measure protein n=1 Tax=Sphingomonas naphthae TaxID=1813468 RepID=A0ABY7TN75_9SPHN|nr:tail tape measure protein [Sphingomonas naphthae]WCT73679.1 tail tape measure protein [Sphingomonas naphthae]
MDEEIERLLGAVRADGGGFARDVAAMRAELEDGLGAGAERAGRAIESALGRAVRSGKFGFDDLRRVALGALDDIARAAVREGVASTGIGGIGGIASVATGLLGGLLGLPGRATGGPVSPGAAYVVGERGPELFVPTASGRVVAAGPVGGTAREVRVAITVNAGGDAAPVALARSGRQVARAVRAALERADP